MIDLSHARRPGRIRAGNGTWCYMAPEQARGGEVTAAGRCVGPGIVLHEASVGHCALSRIADELDVDEPQLHARMPPLRRQRPRLPVALTELVDACLEPDPAGRPSIDDALRGFDAIA